MDCRDYPIELLVHLKNCDRPLKLSLPLMAIARLPLIPPQLLNPLDEFFKSKVTDEPGIIETHALLKQRLPHLHTPHWSKNTEKVENPPDLSRLPEEELIRRLNRLPSAWFSGNVDLALDLAKKGSPGLKGTILHGLAGLKGRKIVEFAAPALNDNDSLVRTMAIEALSLLRNPELIPFLTNLLGETNKKIFYTVLKALALFPENNLEPQLQNLWLKSTDGRLKCGILWASCHLNLKLATSLCVRGLREPDNDLQKGSILGLGLVGDEKGLAYLKRLADQGFGTILQEVRWSIQAIESRLGMGQPLPPPPTVSPRPSPPMEPPPPEQIPSPSPVHPPSSTPAPDLRVEPVKSPPILEVPPVATLRLDPPPRHATAIPSPVATKTATPSGGHHEKKLPTLHWKQYGEIFLALLSRLDADQAKAIAGSPPAMALYFLIAVISLNFWILGRIIPKNPLPRLKLAQTIDLAPDFNPDAVLLNFTLSPKGKIAVLDAKNSEGRLFNDRGIPEEKFPREPNLRLKQPMAACFADNDDLFVADTKNQRIVHFDPSGKFIKSFGKAGILKGDFILPTAMTHLAGNLYVLDTALCRLQQFNLAGICLAKIGRRGEGAEELNKPLGMTFDPNSQLLVADSYNRKINRYDFGLNYLSSIAFGAINRAFRPVAIGTFGAGITFLFSKESQEVALLFAGETIALLTPDSLGCPPGTYWTDAQGRDDKLGLLDGKGKRIFLFELE